MFWKRKKQASPAEELQNKIFKLLRGSPRDAAGICVELGLDDPAEVLAALEQLSARGFGAPNPDPKNLQLPPELQEWSLRFSRPKTPAHSCVCGDAGRRAKLDGPLLITRAPERHGCKLVDEWRSVRGFAPRNPVGREATAVKPWSFTRRKGNHPGALFFYAQTGRMEAKGFGYETRPA